MQRVLLLLPLSVFAVVGFFAVRGLTLDQSKQPSNLIDRPVPAFELADLPNLGPAFSPADLYGQVTLVNVFGSWCAACRIEHPLLLEIGRSGQVPLYGIDWADPPEVGAAWLMRFKNPYHAVGNDESGRTVIGFGVTGAPETFVVDHEGRIRYRHVGPLTEDSWRKTVEPLVRQLQADAKAAAEDS